MKCTVMGKKKVDFVNKDTGERIRSAKLAVSHKYPPNNEAVTAEGLQCSEVTIPFEYIDEIKIGESLLLDFDRNGKLLEMEILN